MCVTDAEHLQGGSQNLEHHTIFEDLLLGVIIGKSQIGSTRLKQALEH